jgi:osmotically-inducible protein OsmY
VDVQAAEGHVRVAGLVGSEGERAGVLAVASDVPGVREVASDLKIFRRPVR